MPCFNFFSFAPFATVVTAVELYDNAQQLKTFFVAYGDNIRFRRLEVLERPSLTRDLHLSCSRTLCITSADGQTGHLLSELMRSSIPGSKNCIASPLTPRNATILKRWAQKLSFINRIIEYLDQNSRRPVQSDTIFLIPLLHISINGSFR